MGIVGRFKTVIQSFRAELFSFTGNCGTQFFCYIVKVSFLDPETPKIVTIIVNLTLNILHIHILMLDGMLYVLFAKEIRIDSLDYYLRD